METTKTPKAQKTTIGVFTIRLKKY